MPFRSASSSYVKDEAKAYANSTNMGEIYLCRISEQPFGKRLVDALEIIAETDNHPLIFHCSAGKDRTGVLAAMVLAAMGVVDEDVVEDYTLSAPLMKDIRDRMTSDPATAQGEGRTCPIFNGRPLRSRWRLFCRSSSGSMAPQTVT